MRRLLYIVPLLVLCLTVQAEKRTDIPCGDWLTIEAHPFPDYVFVKWSDGNTDSVRSIQVNEDATYIAFFAARCEEYANWPVIALYDWLLMLNVQAINEKGYYISPANVTWYRAIGEPDDMHDVFPQDDEVVVQGSYYLTLDKSLQGTGNYYAIVDVSDAKGQLCDGLMRTVIINYSGSDASSGAQVKLLSACVRGGQPVQLVGLMPDENTTVQVFSSEGQLVRTLRCDDTRFTFPAERTAGCYYVSIHNSTQQSVLKYIVL